MISLDTQKNKGLNLWGYSSYKTRKSIQSQSQFIEDKTVCIRLLSEGRNKSIGLNLKVNCDESLVMMIIAFVLFQFWK
jgi:hypothetical protein